MDIKRFKTEANSMSLRNVLCNLTGSINPIRAKRPLSPFLNFSPMSPEYQQVTVTRLFEFWCSPIYHINQVSWRLKPQEQYHANFLKRCSGKPRIKLKTTKSPNFQHTIGTQTLLYCSDIVFN